MSHSIFGSLTLTSFLESSCPEHISYIIIALFCKSGAILDLGVKRSKQLFFLLKSYIYHVAYQIKSNETYNNMQTNILSFTHTLDPWVGLKG